MAFLSQHWDSMSRQTFIPVLCDSVTGCGIYILGSDYFNDSERNSHNAHIHIAYPIRQNNASDSKWKKVKQKGSQQENIKLYLDYTDYSNVYDEDVESHFPDSIVSEFKAEQEIFIEDLIAMNRQNNEEILSHIAGSPDSIRRFFVSAEEDEISRRMALSDDDASVAGAEQKNDVGYKA